MEGGLYQSKVTLSLTFTQRQGHQAHNCKMGLLQLPDLTNIESESPASLAGKLRS